MRVSAPLFRLRVTITYLALAVGSAIFLNQLRPRAQWHVLREASTNLHNLSDGHIVTLVASVFLTDGEVNWLWLASVAALFAVAEWVSGSRRFLCTFLLGHIGATALVAIGHIAALAIGFALGTYYIRADSIAKGANTFDAAITEPLQQDTAMTTLMTHEHR